MNIVTSYFIVKPLRGCMNLSHPPNPRSIAERQKEYIHCLHRNSSHADVRYVHLLVEGEEAYTHLRTHVLRSPAFSAAQRRKIVPFLRLTPAMPTYADLFAHAHRILAPHTDYAMICNADVYVHPHYSVLPTIAALFSAHTSPRSRPRVADDTKHMGCTGLPTITTTTTMAQSSACWATHSEERTRASMRGRAPDVLAPVCTRPPSSLSLSLSSSSSSPSSLALALTRYESESLDDAPLIRDYRGSHDAFIVRPPFPMSFIAAVDHHQNSYQAENVVIHELRQHGYCVINPCHDIRLVHAHAAEVRQWLPSIANRRYARAPPLLLTEALTHV